MLLFCEWTSPYWTMQTHLRNLVKICTYKVHTYVRTYIPCTYTCPTRSPHLYFLPEGFNLASVRALPLFFFMYSICSMGKWLPIGVCALSKRKCRLMALWVQGCSDAICNFLWEQTPIVSMISMLLLCYKAVMLLVASLVVFSTHLITSTWIWHYLTFSLTYVAVLPLSLDTLCGYSHLKKITPWSVSDLSLYLCSTWHIFEPGMHMFKPCFY